MLLAPSVTALDCGWLRTQQRGLSQDGSREEVSLPVPAWLVQHPLGVVVFDVGLHPALADGPESLGPLAKRFTPELAPGGTVAHRLAEHDVDPLGIIRRGEHVTVLYRQRSTKKPGEWLGRLVLGYEDGAVKIFGASIF